MPASEAPLLLCKTPSHYRLSASGDRSFTPSSIRRLNWQSGEVTDDQSEGPTHLHLNAYSTVANYWCLHMRTEAQSLLTSLLRTATGTLVGVHTQPHITQATFVPITPASSPAEDSTLV
ncbi:hypothetical protein TcWFU_007061 [Taenia crassiceps]|uniref:Uncharacterized protein n=1 Tax=Taenia crassiceps TaxID=6207 RepID=A0ABR4Q280_9CEST